MQAADNWLIIANVVQRINMFCDKVVLITGAGSGLGAETSIRFAKEGAKLSLTGRNVPNLEATSKKCQKMNPGHTPLVTPGDLTKEEDMKKIINRTIETYGTLDVLINVAGVMNLGTIEDASLQQFDQMFNTNVRGMYYLSHLATPYLIKAKGNIVNVSSIGGLRAFPEMTAYCMSKAAVDHFTRCAALQLASKQVRVNAVSPGYMATTNAKGYGLAQEQMDAFTKHMIATYPLGRLAERSEVIDGIEFLASDKASCITGQVLSIDGGKNISSPQ